MTKPLVESEAVSEEELPLYYDQRTLSFTDFTDVQTRLVLLPRDEAEGTGAVISAYYGISENSNQVCADDSIVGWVLAHINGNCADDPKDENRLFNEDFAAILSTIRSQDVPIVLTFSNATTLNSSNDVDNIAINAAHALSVNDAFEEEKKSEDLECRNTSTVDACLEASTAVVSDNVDISDTKAEPAPSTNSNGTKAPETVTTTGSPLFSSKHLSSWTSRMSASATALARAANERAKVTSARVAAAVVPEFPTATAILDLPPSRIPSLHLFMQSEAGAWVPVPEAGSSKLNPDAPIPTLLSSMKTSSAVILTNSSYLTLRASAQQAAPSSDEYRYQWYRSPSPLKEWDPLPGANTPAFQPSATEIGYRLRCVVSLDSVDGNAALESMAVETEDIVTASLPILNGSRQALARGAHFGGLLGQGKAEGRTFRVKIVISSDARSHRRRHSKSSDGSSRTVAAVTIYQVSGSTSEPFHAEDEPLICHSAAVTDYGQSKNLALIFDSNILPPSASMVAALCSAESDVVHSLSCSNDKLYFHLQAPNRLARESMILAIGVANFKGKPVELNASSVLFHHHNEELNCVEIDDISSSSSGDSSDLLQSSSSHSSSVSPVKSHLSSGDRTPLPPSPQHSGSLGGTLERHAVIDSDLQEELESLRSKLVRKDKVISELQRQLAQSDKSIQQTEEQLKSLESVSKQHENESNNLRLDLVTAKQKLDELSREFQTMKTEQDARHTAIECDLQLHKDRISKLEKENRMLQNDKDVLKAAVETRELKLSKMSELQASLDDAKAQLSLQNDFQLKVDEADKRYAEAKAEIQQMQTLKGQHEEELKKSNARIVALEQALQEESSKTLSHQSKLEMDQMTIQKLKAERNSYKQKGDSLAKEMSRLCRDGRTVRDIEKILADDATRSEEVIVLREQKRKALEQVDHFRMAYEQSLSAQRRAGLDHDAGKLLERNAELERLLTELTEYLNAKEMQLDTMKQVNDALQSEIRELAKAHMSKNDI